MTFGKNNKENTSRDENLQQEWASHQKRVKKDVCNNDVYCIGNIATSQPSQLYVSIGSKDKATTMP